MAPATLAETLPGQNRHAMRHYRLLHPHHESRRLAMQEHWRRLGAYTSVSARYASAPHDDCHLDVSITGEIRATPGLLQERAQGITGTHLNERSHQGADPIHQETRLRSART